MQERVKCNNSEAGISLVTVVAFQQTLCRGGMTNGFKIILRTSMTYLCELEFDDEDSLSISYEKTHQFDLCRLKFSTNEKR